MFQQHKLDNFCVHYNNLKKEYANSMYSVCQKLLISNVNSHLTLFFGAHGLHRQMMVTTNTSTRGAQTRIKSAAGDSDDEDWGAGAGLDVVTGDSFLSPWT